MKISVLRFFASRIALLTLFVIPVSEAVASSPVISAAKSIVYTDSSQALGLNTSYSVVLGDVDGDGDLDKIVANFKQGNKVWLNDGYGNYTDSGQSLGGAKSRGVVIGDTDGDLDLDLMFADRTSLGIFKNVT